jgi:VanZ family protein
MTRLMKLRLFYIGPLIFWMAVIFFGSTSFGSASSSHRLLIRVLDLLDPDVSHRLSAETLDMLNLVIRKMGHLTEYAILTLLAVRAIQFGEPRLKPRAPIGAFLISVLYACSDEFHQRFVPGRTSSPHDVLIDSVSVSLVIIGILIWFAVKSAERQLWKEGVGCKEWRHPTP